MELFNLVIIVHVREELLLEILLELLPHDLFVSDLLNLPEVLPRYWCCSIQIEDGYSCLHISRVVLDLEIFLHPKKPSFSFLTSLYLTIKSRRPFLFNFIMWIFPVAPLPLIPMRWRAWTPSGSFRVKWSTRRPFSSSGTAPTSFQICCPMPRIYLPLDVC